MPSVPELLIILLIVLLIFGAGKLPAIGDALGRSIKNFKRSASGADEIEVGKKQELETKKRAELKGAAAADDDDGEVEEAEVVSAKKKKKAAEEA